MHYITDLNTSIEEGYGATYGPAGGSERACCLVCGDASPRLEFDLAGAEAPVAVAVAEVDAKLNISRITIVTTGTPQVIDQIKLQLRKLVPVHKVADFKRKDKNVIFKEMALFKLVGNISKRKKAFNACKKYNAVILDKTNKSYVVQVTALRREIDVMSKNLKKLGLVSVSRTGAVAMTRGAEIFK